MHKRYRAVQRCLYLFRPDGYIDYRSRTLNREAFQCYLDEIVLKDS